MNSVSRETDELLNRYSDLVNQWNRRINLVAPSTLSDFRNRHIEDCLQLVDLIEEPSGHWVDMGSGGGLPGIVLATAMRDKPVRFTFMESDQRKGAFLRAALREMGLTNSTIRTERIEAIEPMSADYISARALAAMPSLLDYVHRHLSKNGVALLMKGRTWRDECAAARKIWQFDLTDFASRTDSEAAILKVTGVSHA